ncbi:MAG: nucleotidyltransferase family protein [Idiomarina sp.]|nr:nucleotidyltransferase family protein [Idiomarina sp.]
MRAMILAAGRGERMRPLTDHTPKPLLQVGGQPLIAWHLQRLQRIGVDTVVINTAWLSEQLVAAIGDGEAFGVHVIWSHEPEGGLETAGGLRAARAHLEQGPFILVNGDIYTDYDFANLPRQVVPGSAHIILVTNPPHHPQGDFSLSNGRVVHAQAHAQVQSLTYSGIAMIHPDFLKPIAEGKQPLRPYFEQSINAGLLFGEHYMGRWADVGTPERLAQLNRELTR